MLDADAVVTIRPRRTRCELPPPQAIGRVRELLGHPARADELCVQLGKVAPRHAHVDVVRQVPARVVGHEHQAGDAGLAHDIVVSRRSFDRVMPAC